MYRLVTVACATCTGPTRGIAQNGRADASGASGRGFQSRFPDWSRLGCVVKVASPAVTREVGVRVPAPQLWKGEPTGDGSRLENGRATALRVRLPPLPPCVPLAERRRHRFPKPDTRVRAPQGTLGDRLMVGQQPLKLCVKVRLFLPELRGPPGRQ